MLSEKVVIDPGRYKGHSFWRRFPGLNLVTLVTTLNSTGEVEVNYQGMGMPLTEDGPYFLLTCAANSPFYKNISQWGEFIINYPGINLVETLHFWALNFPKQQIKPEDVGLKIEQAEKVKPSRIQECYAHLECCLEREMYHQGHIMIMGRILAGYLDENLAGNSGEIDLPGNLTRKLVGYIFPYGYSLIHCAQAQVNFKATF